MGKLIPRIVKKKVNDLLVYSTIKIPVEKLLGMVGFYSFLLALFFGFLLRIFLPFWLGFIAIFALSWLFLYVWVLLSIDKKAKFVEGVLPDALQLMSSNIRAGITTDKALLLSARPEFGPFAEEIKRVGREIMTGREFSVSLKKITETTKSETLAKTIDLIIISIKSGGKLADVLDQISDDLREEQMVQKEISASVLMYVIFIFIAIAFGAPLLFAMSSFLVTLLRENINLITTQLPAEQLEQAPIAMGSMQIPEFINIFGNQIPFLTVYSLTAIFFTAVFGSLIMGLIMSGDEKDGIKFLPILLILAIGLYLAGGFVLETFLGGMMRV